MNPLVILSWVQRWAVGSRDLCNLPIYIYIYIYLYRRVDICRTAYRVLNSKLERSTFETNQQYI